MLSPGTIIQGRYRVERLLSQGGQGSVYVVTHLNLAIKRAMKVVMKGGHQGDPAWAQLEREARILSGLRHPNLAQVTDIVVEPAYLGVVMEYVEGVSLDVRRGTCAPEGWVLSIAAQVLDVLEYLHAQRPPVLHRDLNPRNILLATDGRIRVVDFGIAKVPVTGGATETVVRGYGTSGFAPPEQYGRGGTGAASDIYALGATMLSLLGPSDPPDAIERIQGRPLIDPRQSNPTVSANTWAVLQQMMSIRQPERPQSAIEARRLLFVGNVSGGVPPQPQPRMVAPPRVAATPQRPVPTPQAPPPPGPSAPPAPVTSSGGSLLDSFIAMGSWRTLTPTMVLVFYLNQPPDEPMHVVTNLVLFSGLILNALLSSILRATRAKSNKPSPEVGVILYVLLWCATFAALMVGVHWLSGQRGHR